MLLHVLLYFFQHHPKPTAVTNICPWPTVVNVIIIFIDYGIKLTEITEFSLQYRIKQNQYDWLCIKEKMKMCTCITDTGVGVGSTWCPTLFTFWSKQSQSWSVHAYSSMLAIIFAFKTVLHFTLGSPLRQLLVSCHLPPPQLNLVHFHFHCLHTERMDLLIKIALTSTYMSASSCGGFYGNVIVPEMRVYTCLTSLLLYSWLHIYATWACQLLTHSPFQCSSGIFSTRFS